jgi:hypothetical protein
LDRFSPQVIRSSPSRGVASAIGPTLTIRCFKVHAKRQLTIGCPNTTDLRVQMRIGALGCANFRADCPIFSSALRHEFTRWPRTRPDINAAD